MLLMLQRALSMRWFGIHSESGDIYYMEEGQHQAQVEGRVETADTLDT